MKDNSKLPRGEGALRRDVLKGFASAAAITAFSGTAFAQQAKEAPALAELATGKKIPPLSERIPSNPLVVQVEKVGKYGGSLRRGLRGSADHNGILRMVGNQGLVRWNLAFTEVLPNVAEKWEVNADSTEFTFHPAQGHEVVGRQAVHRRRRRLRDRGLRQESRTLQVGSDADRHWRQAGHGDQGRRRDREVHLRRARTRFSSNSSQRRSASIRRSSRSTTAASSIRNTTRMSASS